MNEMQVERFPCTLRPFELDAERTNVITTAKFTWFNAVPFLLCFILKEPLNVVMILVVFLYVLPTDAPRDGVTFPIRCGSWPPSALIPVLFVVSITVWRLLDEDAKRRAMDNAANSKSLLVLEEAGTTQGQPTGRHHADPLLQSQDAASGLEPMERSAYNFQWDHYRVRSIPWGELKSGAIIEIPPGSSVPADCLILDTSIKVQFPLFSKLLPLFF